MNENNDQQKFLKNFYAVAPKHCDNCGNKYSETDFQVIKTSPVNLVFHLKCHTCGNSYMLNFLNPSNNGLIGAQRTPINIDLQTDTEIQKFAGKEAITKNEAVDIYNNINSESTLTDLKKLLS